MEETRKGKGGSGKGRKLGRAERGNLEVRPIMHNTLVLNLNPSNKLRIIA